MAVRGALQANRGAPVAGRAALDLDQGQGSGLDHGAAASSGAGLDVADRADLDGAAGAGTWLVGRQYLAGP